MHIIDMTTMSVSTGVLLLLDAQFRLRSLVLDHSIIASHRES